MAGLIASKLPPTMGSHPLFEERGQARSYRGE